MSYFVLSSVFVINDSFATESETEPTPHALIRTVAMSTLDRIKNQRESALLSIESIDNIIEEELMPYVDFRYAAFKVLGPNVRKATSTELVDFVEAFRHDLAVSFSTVLSGLNDHRIEVETATYLPSDRFISIKSLVISSAGPPINIVFKLRMEPKIKKWQVYDIETEGISLITSKKSEIDPIIRKHGIQHATALLNKKDNNS